jgi:two-component system cell cycle response regulator DivK
MKGDEEKIREGGCDGYIEKPISLSDFLETVERFAGPPVAEREAV